MKLYVLMRLIPYEGDETIGIYDSEEQAKTVLEVMLKKWNWLTEGDFGIEQWQLNETAKYYRWVMEDGYLDSDELEQHK